MQPTQLALNFSPSHIEILTLLDAWAEAGWLRRLDSAFARFCAELAPDSPAEVLLAAALLAHMEGRGHSCLLLDELQRAPQALLNWPEEAAAALQAVLVRLPHQWMPALAASSLADGRHPQQPLVLDQSRLYLRRYWHYEARVAQRIGERAAVSLSGDIPQIRHWLDRLFSGAVDQPPNWQKIACAVALQGQLAIITGGPGTGKTYTVARLLALLLATAPKDTHLRIALAAPTGKAAARLKQSIDHAMTELVQKLGDTLPLAELAQRIGAARTLHSLLGARPDTRRFRHHAGNPLEVDVLIVDEASMIHLEMMDALLDALPASARLILLGDKDQLASVEAGAVLGDLCREAQAGHYRKTTCAAIQSASGETIPAAFCSEQGSALAQQTVMLRTSRRFGGPIGQLALAVNQGDTPAALEYLQRAAEGILQWLRPRDAQAVVALALQGRAGAEGGYRSYLELVQSPPDMGGKSATPAEMHAAQLIHETWVKSVLQAFECFRILCALRDGEWGVAGLNRAIESALLDAGLIRKNGEWYAGRPVMITRNDASAGVFNGDIGIALPAFGQRSAMRVYFLDGDAVRSVLTSRLAEVETAYAMTVHKSQGSEFRHTVLVLPAHANRVLTRELIYTGITRARERFTLVASQGAVLEQAIASQTRRASGLAEKLAFQPQPTPLDD